MSCHIGVALLFCPSQKTYRSQYAADQPRAKEASLSSLEVVKGCKTTLKESIKQPLDLPERGRSWVSAYAEENQAFSEVDCRFIVRWHKAMLFFMFGSLFRSLLLHAVTYSVKISYVPLPAPPRPAPPAPPAPPPMKFLAL